MHLSFRGVKYRFAPILGVVKNSEVIGRYRGQTCRRSHFDLAVSHPRVALKYRGVSYMPGLHGRVANRPIESLVREQMAPVAVTSDARQVQSELEKIHNLSIQKSLERRLSVARDQGNQNLVHILEDEQKQLAS